jgi:hypothetical protein
MHPRNGWRGGMKPVTSPEWAVVCPDYTKDGFKSRMSAEQWKERIEASGECPHQHEIVRVG